MVSCWKPSAISRSIAAVQTNIFHIKPFPSHAAFVHSRVFPVFVKLNDANIHSEPSYLPSVGANLTEDRNINKNNVKWSRNLKYRWITGLSLGAIGTLWIASGNGIFPLGFLLASLIAQNEYYAMVRATGLIPAYKVCFVNKLIIILISNFPK